MITNSENEVWKDFSKDIWRENEIFKVSNLGRVLRFKYSPRGEFMKLYSLLNYSVFSCVKKSGKSDLIYVHRAVASLFSEQDETRPFVIHKNFDKKNNHYKNLQYVNREELTAHNLKNPAVIASKLKARENPKYSKLSAGKVKMIKRKIFDPNRKTRMRLIAKQFGISEMQLYRIKSGENWGHIIDY
jgi:hypothetical protein